MFNLVVLSITLLFKILKISFTNVKMVIVFGNIFAILVLRQDTWLNLNVDVSFFNAF